MLTFQSFLSGDEDNSSADGINFKSQLTKLLSNVIAARNVINVDAATAAVEVDPTVDEVVRYPPLMIHCQCLIDISFARPGSKRENPCIWNVL